LSKTIEIYTDGSSLGNPGPGGYGAVLISGKHRKELSAGYRKTTNNRMEMMGVIAGLNAVKKAEYKIILHTDSQLIFNTMTKGWLESWVKKGWKKADKKPVLNRDLWEKIIELTSKLNVEWKWVKAHVGIEENERCDELAKEAAESDDLLIDSRYEAGL
jgi:ribonuclease HI